MRAFIIFFIYVLILSTQAMATTCSLDNEDFTRYLKNLDRDPQLILYKRIYLDHQFAACELSPEAFGKSPNFLDDLEQKAYAMEYNDLKKTVLKEKRSSRVEYYTKKMHEYAEKGKFLDPKIENELATMLTNFKKSNDEFKMQPETNFNNSCQKGKNLSHKLPPVRNQDTIGWCYAFVAADLVSAKLGRAVSAFDIALGYESKRYADTYSPKPSNTGKGGFIETALAENALGYCSESELKSSGTLYELGTAMTMLDGAYELQTKDLDCDIYASVSQFSKKLKLKDLPEIIGQNNYSTSLTLLRSRACPNRIKPKQRLESSTIYYPNQNYVSKYEIQKALVSDRPVGITVLLNSILHPVPEKQSSHAMVIVGQELNGKNECEFIIRNSWGSECSVFDQTKITCKKDGSLRIKPELLDQILTSTTVIK